MSTGIEWTDETWNPTTGCDQVSPGCDNCYALTMAARLKGMGSAKYQTDGDPRTSGPGFGLAMHPDTLYQPLRWRKPRKVFVNSMSDLFHPKVTDDFIAEVFGVMAVAYWHRGHTFQVLTKRPKRMRSYLDRHRSLIAAAAHRWAIDRVTAGWLSDGIGRGVPDRWPLPNVWLGTSVEDQQRADERIPALLDTPAAVRFLSCEPLLGPVNLGPAALRPYEREQGGFWEYGHGEDVYGNGKVWVSAPPAQIDWVIVGGESGPGARPMHPGWARTLRDQCVDAGIAFHFKQWGAWVSIWDQAPVETFVEIDNAVNLAGNPQHMWRVGKKRAGRLLDGRTWDEFPQAVSA